MIPYGKHHIDDNDIQAVVAVLRSDALTQGPKIAEFERSIANYVGAKFAVAVSSGTAALHLAAIVAGASPGTTLITSPITFVASANAGLYAGADVAFADIDPETVNMSPDALGCVLAEHPKARVVIPVHFSGLPCDMPSIKSSADRSGAIVIEDAAHALGASYPDGTKVGCCSHSMMTIFSFHPVKAIAAGEGGMITTNDENIYRELLRLRSHGINKLDDRLLCPEDALTNGLPNPWYYEMQELGYHYRISDLNCGLALSQFKKIDSFIDQRRKIAERYDAAFSSMENCQPIQEMGRALSAHHLYVLKIDFPAACISRAELMIKLQKRGIGTQVHYIPVPAQPYYRRLGFVPESYGNACKYYEEALSIPIYFDLTVAQQDKVISAIMELIG